MSTFDGHYTIEELLVLRDSPLVAKPEGLPQMDQWMQPATERRNVSNTQSHGNANGEASEVRYRSADSRRSRGDSIVLGPPQMSFASSLHSPTLRKSNNKDSTLSSTRNRPSSPSEDLTLSTSPPEEDEPGWNKVRSTARGNAVRGYDRERRGGRSDRRPPRESFGETATKGTAFRSAREGDSQNWRSDRTEPRNLESLRNGRRDEPETLEDDEEFGGRGGAGGEHSAEEFQAWIAKMRGKPVETAKEAQDDSVTENEPATELQKNEKSKIVDVDSLFALDPPTLDEGDSTAPASSVFFDSAPTGGRASRFRQLFAQDPPAQPASLDARPSVDRTTSNPVFDTAPKSSATAEDREGFQRIMAMLGGGGPQKSSFMEKSPPAQPQAQPPIPNGPAQGESRSEFFQRLLRQGQGGGPVPPAFLGPPPQMPMNQRPNPPLDPSRPPPQLDLDARLGRPPPQQSQHPRSPPAQPDPRFPPFDLPPPPPQGGPWMGPPPGFSPPNSRYAFPPGPPLSPGLHPPPPPPGGFGPPPPGMMPFGGPPPGFGRGVFSPPLPPPGQDTWHGPPGFGYYQEGESRDR